MKFNALLTALFITAALYQLSAQDQNRWQQACKYFMEIDMNVEKHQFKGVQTIIYYNNSPDEISKVFYHLYFNAFQPGSEMDEMSRKIIDPDPRVGNRISKLKPEETGWHKIKTLNHNGKAVKYHVEETILEVTLNTPIKPGAADTFYMEFESQIPIQVRRSGRNSAEGIEYSMSQWYPKMCEYDYQGWHPNPYVAREFYGIWGDFDVKITIPKNYVIGGTGYLQNKNEIGHGYQDEGLKPDNSKKEKLTWHFFAPKVHDFFWGADPDYLHNIVKLDDTTDIHFFYQNDKDYAETWVESQATMIEAFKFIEKQYGDYPYRQYSFVQGGDGGMEYPMGTLITGRRPFPSLVGVMIHELMHNWFQMLMGSNEALHAWMDEGFTSFSSEVVQDHLFNKKNAKPELNLQKDSYDGYFAISKAGIEEPLSVHADHYMTNTAYSSGAYNKGAVFLKQLEYIIGKEAFDQGMLDYYKNWSFKHPNPNDFIRVMEKRSGLELDWYKEYWVNTIHTIDYAIDSVYDDKKDTKIILERKIWEERKNKVKNGRMPMPIDLVVEYQDGKKTKTANFYIPLDLMRGEKPDEGQYGERTVLKDWWWTHATYEFEIPIKFKNITKITIDPSTRMADVDVQNNVWINK